VEHGQTSIPTRALRGGGVARMRFFGTVVVAVRPRAAAPRGGGRLALPAPGLGPVLRARAPAVRPAAPGGEHLQARERAAHVPLRGRGYGDQSGVVHVHALRRRHRGERLDELRRRRRVQGDRRGAGSLHRRDDSPRGESRPEGFPVPAAGLVAPAPAPAPAPGGVRAQAADAAGVLLGNRDNRRDARLARQAD
jgi:hypothetical protein